jgi:hypothetical protein
VTGAVIKAIQQFLAHESLQILMHCTLARDRVSDLAVRSRHFIEHHVIAETITVLAHDTSEPVLHLQSLMSFFSQALPCGKKPPWVHAGVAAINARSTHCNLS